MPTLKGKYNIKAVSNMIGIQPSTLRAWERRYHIIAPKRNHAGHRLYTEEHIRVLKWLMDKVNEGITIGQAVQLLEGNRLQNYETKEADFGKEAVLVDDILQYLLKFDEIKTSVLLNEAFSIYSAEKVITNIFLQVANRLADLGKNNEITMMQVRYAESFLQSRLGMIYHNAHVHASLPKVLALSSDVSTLHVFILTTYVRLKGYQALYIGTSLEETDIHETIEQLKPKYLFISSQKEQKLEEIMNLIEKLQMKNEKLYIGFLGFVGQSDQLKRQNLFVGNTKEEWDEWLKMSE
ncbi:MerR family transcriptional regulator [Bacillus clarus]|uniref:MerR family transcriptional regulator n=1 Tax=Bacillus clarus TaxID=2338372 RepID=A0A090ZCL7_9BACI|nr:MerR family transcriptional regulator [Bacillus clarus]KFN02021.1 merR regulatory family protein [Bacillus clarus]RFT68351.1 MerR family transcriptional regulator [Bacillus clarus]